MSFLKDIIQTKKEELIILKKQINDLELDSNKRNYGDFLKALSKDNLNIIAEVKKASPSQGVIKKDFDPIKTAKIYEEHHANAISVLTDKKYFQGSIDFLKEIRENVSTPILRKDFIIDEAQVFETAASKADAFLLIAAALPLRKLKSLMAEGRKYNLEFILEIHDEADLKKALKTDAEIIGINNRNLKTFEVDLSTGLKLSQKLPSDRKVIIESGIRSVRELHLYTEIGINTFLIGQFLMENSNPGNLLTQLKNAKG